MVISQNVPISKVTEGFNLKNDLQEVKNCTLGFKVYDKPLDFFESTRIFWQNLDFSLDKRFIKIKIH